MNPLSWALDEPAFMELALQVVQFALAVVGLVAIVVCGTAARCCLCELFGSSPKRPDKEFHGLGQARRAA